MSRCKYTTKEIELLARLLNAEAVGEGATGMLLVGNVCINRVVAKCLEFKKITSIKQMIYQRPGGFEGVNSPLFNSPPSALQKNLAKRAVTFWRGHPATKALFFRTIVNKECLNRFYGDLAGRYKKHCFYNPDDINACNL